MSGAADAVTSRIGRAGYRIWSVERALWPEALRTVGISPEDWPDLTRYGFAPLYFDISVPQPTPSSRFFPNDPTPLPRSSRFAPVCEDIIGASLNGVPGDIASVYGEYWSMLLTMIAVYEDLGRDGQTSELVDAVREEIGFVHTGFVDRLMLRALDDDSHRGTVVLHASADGWRPVTQIAQANGLDAEIIQEELAADRRDRRRRPGRDRRWRDRSWIHSTELDVVRRILDAREEQYWKQVRHALSTRLREMRRAEARLSELERRRHVDYLRSMGWYQNYEDDT